MSMTAATCTQLIRNRIHAQSPSTISDVDILITLNAAYQQWWRMFYDKPLAVAGGTATTCSMATGVGVAKLVTAGVVEVVSVYATTTAAQMPTDASSYPLEEITPNEMRYLWHMHSVGESPGAGFPDTPTTGAPAVYSVEFWQANTADANSGFWYLTVYPKCSVTYYFPVIVRIFPANIATGTNPISQDDETVGLCAVTALRLLSVVGKHNDQGLVAAITSEIPAQMQQMALQLQPKSTPA